MANFYLNGYKAKSQKFEFRSDHNYFKTKTKDLQCQFFIIHGVFPIRTKNFCLKNVLIEHTPVIGPTTEIRSINFD